MKLTKREMDRLVDIYNFRFSSCGGCPAITAALIAKGLVGKRGGCVAKSGRIMQHADAFVTWAGRQVLAGMPVAEQGESK